MTTGQRRRQRPRPASVVKRRMVDIQRQSVTRDSFGGQRESWVSVAKSWAHVQQTGVSERFENDAARKIPARFAKFRIPWRDGINETARVVYDGLAWDIEGIAEIGRRRELELTCRTDASRRV